MAESTSWWDEDVLKKDDEPSSPWDPLNLGGDAAAPAGVGDMCASGGGAGFPRGGRVPLMDNSAFRV